MPNDPRFMDLSQQPDPDVRLASAYVHNRPQAYAAVLGLLWRMEKAPHLAEGYLLRDWAYVFPQYGFDAITTYCKALIPILAVKEKLEKSANGNRLSS